MAGSVPLQPVGSHTNARPRHRWDRKTMAPRSWAPADSERESSASRPANPEIPKILARLESESDAAAIRNYVAALESLGLDALPWIEEALEKFPNDRASRTALVELADRLANTVRDATLAADGFTSPAELDAKVNAMKGSRPSATALVQLWLDACAALPNGLWKRRVFGGARGRRNGRRDRVASNGRRGREACRLLPRERHGGPQLTLHGRRSIREKPVRGASTRTKTNKRRSKKRSNRRAKIVRGPPRRQAAIEASPRR